MDQALTDEPNFYPNLYKSGHLEDGESVKSALYTYVASKQDLLNMQLYTNADDLVISYINLKERVNTGIEITLGEDDTNHGFRGFFAKLFGWGADDINETVSTNGYYYVNRASSTFVGSKQGNYEENRVLTDTQYEMMRSYYADNQLNSEANRYSLYLTEDKYGSITDGLGLLQSYNSEFNSQNYYISRFNADCQMGINYDSGNKSYDLKSIKKNWTTRAYGACSLSIESYMKMNSSIFSKDYQTIINYTDINYTNNSKSPVGSDSKGRIVLSEISFSGNTVADTNKAILATTITVVTTIIIGVTCAVFCPPLSVGAITAGMALKVAVGQVIRIVANVLIVSLATSAVAYTAGFYAYTNTLTRLNDDAKHKLALASDTKTSESVYSYLE